MPPNAKPQSQRREAVQLGFAQINMKIQILIGLVFMFLSCTEKKLNHVHEIGSMDSIQNSTKIGIEDEQDYCHDWLSDTTFSTGAFIKSLKQAGKIYIEWGNNTF